MKTQVNLTTTESKLLTKVQRTKDVSMYEATVFVTGVFGGGTVTLQASPDQGVTKVNLRDIAGAVVSITADDVYNIKLGDGSKNSDYIEIYATMTGGAAQNVLVTGFDNM